MKKHIIFCMSLFFSLIVSGQDHYRLLEVEYEYAPNIRQENSVQNEVDIQEYEANISMPIKRSNGDAYVMGFGYNDLSLFPSITSNDQLPDTIMNGNHNYGRLRLQGGYSKKFNDELSMVFMGFFRVASDWVDVNSDHYLYGGLAMVTKKKSEKFTLKYGLYVNTEHYGWLIIPLIGCDWKASKKLRIYGVMPRRLTVAWTLNKKFRAGFIWEAPNRTYRISQNGVKISDGTPLDTYVQNIKNVVYGFGEVYLTKSLVLRGRIGYTLFREIELYEYSTDVTYISWGIEYGAKRTRINDVYAYQPLEDGIVLNASIEYRFSLD